MANTYYDSQLTAAEIEEVLEAIKGILTPANNGKVLAINNGKFEARSVQWGGGEPTIEPLSVTENGTYTAPSGVDGYSPITVNVPGSSAVVQPLSVTQNGTYNPPSGVDGYAPVVVNVSGGGGSTNILSGSISPTSAQGSDGDIYLKYFVSSGTITNVRMVIYGVRESGFDVQISELQLLDSNDNALLWGSGTATSNGNVYSAAQKAEKAFDNITNNKWYTNSKPSAVAPIWIDFEPDTPIVANTIFGWQWWTGGDEYKRDPVSFDLLLSTDGGTTYITVDHMENAVITRDRNALAYTHEVTLENGIILSAYCKVNGVWQLLVGTNISDVNLGGN